MSINTKFKISADGLAGLKENFSKDAMSGFLVFLLAMPLSLGIAKASQFPMLFGLVTAIVGGLVVSFFMGSRLSIKGPAAGLIVIASGSVSAFGDGEAGWHLALGAIVVAALFQILFGLLKLGRFADFFPSSVIHGMLAAIGIIIMAKQLNLLFGINPAELKGKEPLELLAMLPSSILHENAHLTEIGIACLVILFGMSYVKNEKIKKIPPPLVVLLVSIPLGIVLHIKTDGAIANFALVKIGSIVDVFKSGIVNVDFSGITTHTGVFIQYVILYALIGSIESLLTAKAVDDMDPYKRKTNYDKDLISVGIGNAVSGVLGGLPMISEVARSSANVSYGAKTRWANFFHGLFLLLAILFAVPVIEMIPNVSLSAMLVFVGFRLAHPSQFVHAYKIGKEQLAIFATTVLVTLSTDLLVGVGSGVFLKLVIHVANGVTIKDLFFCSLKVDHVNGRYQVNVKSDMVFTNLLSFKRKVAEIPEGKKMILDLSEVKLIDHSSLMMIKALAENYSHSGGVLEITGLDKHKGLSDHDESTKLLRSEEVQ